MDGHGSSPIQITNGRTDAGRTDTSDHTEGQDLTARRASSTVRQSVGPSSALSSHQQEGRDAAFTEPKKAQSDKKKKGSVSELIARKNSLI